MDKTSYANLVSAVLHFLVQIYFKLQNVTVFAISKIPNIRRDPCLSAERFVKLTPFSTFNATILMGYLPNIFPF